MTKIIKTIIILFLMPSSLFAMSWYAGINVGYDRSALNKYSTGTTTFAEFPSIPPDPFPAVNGSTNFSGILTGLYVGADKNWGRFNLGSEFSVKYNSSATTSRYTANADHHAVKEQWGPEIGLSILPGLNFKNNFRIYTRLGLAYSKFESSSASDDGPGPHGLSHFAKFIPGWNIGIGFQKKFIANMALRLEYNEVIYDNFSGNSENDAGEEIIYNVHTQYSRVKQSQILLGLNYYF